MASIHHLIGWHAWLLPSSPWQCECPPSSHHHGNGSVPQQPSAWAECKPLNQDHHGNMCLLKHQAAVCLGVCVCVCVCNSDISHIIRYCQMKCSLSICHCTSQASFSHFTASSYWWVGGCHDVARVLSGARQEV